MTEPRILRGYELGEIPAAEAAAAMAVARRIEAATMVVSPAATIPGFTDRVMTALADEPGPAPVAFIAPLRKLGVLAGFGTSIRQAWATLERPGRSTFARAAALAYVLTVAAAGVSLAGAAMFGAAGAFGLLGPAAMQRATPTPAPLVAPVITPDAVTEPSEEPSIEPSPEPSEPADETNGPDDHGGGTGPEASDDHDGGTRPEATDDRGDNSGPGGGDDSGQGGTDDPGSSDDGGGSGGGGSD
jgi:uncharacterized membrane protein YgcG